MSQSLQTETTPEQSEVTQVQNVIQKNNNKIVGSRQAKMQVIVPRCHYCSHPSPKLESPKSTFTLPSGQILSFCNDTEMNNWKKEYGY